jgi:hypothetical protein
VRLGGILGCTMGSAASHHRGTPTTQSAIIQPLHFYVGEEAPAPPWCRSLASSAPRAPRFLDGWIDGATGGEGEEGGDLYIFIIDKGPLFLSLLSFDLAIVKTPSHHDPRPPS